MQLIKFHTNDSPCMNFTADIKANMNCTIKWKQFPRDPNILPGGPLATNPHPYTNLVKVAPNPNRALVMG